MDAIRPSPLIPKDPGHLNRQGKRGDRKEQFVETIGPENEWGNAKFVDGRYIREFLSVSRTKAYEINCQIAENSDESNRGRPGPRGGQLHRRLSLPHLSGTGWRGRTVLHLRGVVCGGGGTGSVPRGSGAPLPRSRLENE